MDRENEIELNIDSIGLVPNFPCDTGDAIVWVPDAVDVYLRTPTDSGDDAEIYHSNTCLEQMFLLLNQLEQGTSGVVLWGSSGIDVTTSGERVELTHKGITLVGSRSSSQRVIEALIREVFAELQRQEVDTQEIAQKLREGRFAPWTIDPLEVHNRLMN